LKPNEFTAYLKEEGLKDVIDWRAKNGKSGEASRESYSKYAKSLLVSGVQR
jgi:hypothetical protein